MTVRDRDRARPDDADESAESLRARLRTCESYLERAERYIDQKEQVLAANALELRALAEELREAKGQVEAKGDELERANARLRDVDRRRATFLSSAAHELRTPITSIVAFARLLQRHGAAGGGAGGPTAECGEHLEIIVQETERLARLVNDLLDLARIEAGRIEWRFVSLAASDVVGPAVTAARPLLDAWRVSLATEIPEGLPRIRADRDRLLQAIANLVTWAGRQTPPDGRVRVSARAASLAPRSEAEPPAEIAQPFVLFSVRDAGRGLAPADLGRVFDKFTRAANAVPDRSDGTGLGLAIAKEVVEAHGGWIWAVSDIGRGTTFSFCVPVADEERPSGGRPTPDSLLP